MLTSLLSVLRSATEVTKGNIVVAFYGDNFDEEGVRKIAETARGEFEGMPGLRSKAFTINSGKREATNFYVWDSADAAKTFFHR
jgi:heme-degrading monooxygenase HmoA